MYIALLVVLCTTVFNHSVIPRLSHTQDHHCHACFASCVFELHAKPRYNVIMTLCFFVCSVVWWGGYCQCLWLIWPCHSPCAPGETILHMAVLLCSPSRKSGSLLLPSGLQYALQEPSRDVVVMAEYQPPPVPPHAAESLTVANQSVPRSESPAMPTQDSTNDHSARSASDTTGPNAFSGVYATSAKMLQFLVDEVLGAQKNEKAFYQSYRKYLLVEASGSLYTHKTQETVKYK